MFGNPFQTKWGFDTGRPYERPPGRPLYDVPTKPPSHRRVVPLTATEESPPMAVPPPVVPLVSDSDSSSRRQTNAGHNDGFFHGLATFMSGAFLNPIDRSRATATVSRQLYARGVPPPTGSFDPRSTSPNAQARSETRRTRTKTKPPAGLTMEQQKKVLRCLRYHAQPLATPVDLASSQSCLSAHSSETASVHAGCFDVSVFAGCVETATHPYTSIIACSVCLVNFKNEEDVAVLPCGHIFHFPCVVKWLLANPTCPFCRSEVKPQTNELEDTSHQPTS
ncbi:Ring finger domain/RING-like zinc finger/Zinc finger, C3HC4 type (RING finger)/RING-H2 zinc finger domain/zinc-RING finger domain/Prokaryotic RING finger family 4, putative [Angomonas deanei]|uniref:RING-type E3 ubiquitin transferase n=1 Tax=Angomonas deanei TaxID=59799 RepID=A0A7G2CQZ9_9TRYP|nr:Ring finger domain/RING-like zinc finger/Zinc finger, C3HC4 type (RING finger)/RING-H2 zinc finger domain/zinc-RING finger domain/Prokaryotic RING finger family 4, putative [Angomonas deanei]